MNKNIEPIVVSDESTVVAEYAPDGFRETAYQSEEMLEQKFISDLKEMAYEHLSITNEPDLIANLRKQLEKLNDVKFSDAEWQQFFDESIASANDGIVEKTRRIQEDHVQVLKRDDGTDKNIRLIDKYDIHSNSLQVINQYEAKGKRANRYDVTVLVNGLPLVHIELKRRGVDIREAFNQINRYGRESFWAGNGLFEYVQLFVISNGTYTKYYSNTVRENHISEQATKRKRHANKTSNSFAFTCWWSDAKNNTISELADFTDAFFSKRTILNLLTRYCVFDVSDNLLVMRPYQIVAVEKILEKIEISTNYKKLGTVEAGGYIWHTTGSGKTLTSFKTAQLVVNRLSYIDKVLFVVDRKDLDYQTMREYERFKKGAANSNTSTKILRGQLEDSSSRIIITTIQKLARFVKKYKTSSVYTKHVAIIFDECHRSQFGEMHTAITKSFKKYHLFGFTGTPIFADNASSSGNIQRRTTLQAFGLQLHAYTIVDAIRDKNVLPFRVDYIKTIRREDEIIDKKVTAINKKEVLHADKRIARIVKYILEHFDQKTRRNVRYTIASKRLNGFNSLFATDSIAVAKLYYREFAKQQKNLGNDRRLKIGLIYSFAPNEEEETSYGMLGEEEFETEDLDANDRDFLDEAIKDYNKMFATNFDTSSEKFQNYYKDLSQKIKNREIDLVIVANMFLTGFDATTLNTLWLDKNLRSHGLLQAYSRTNRILNSVKTYGNIVSFRNLDEETKESLKLFGNKNAEAVVLLKPYKEYHEDYQEKIAELMQKFKVGKNIASEKAQKEFIVLFGKILKLRNILVSFDEFENDETINERDLQDYQSLYLRLYADFRSLQESDKESIIDDVVFEIELIKQVEINVDYILALVEEYLQHKGTAKGKKIRKDIDRAVESSPSLHNKKDLIDDFINSVSAKAKVDEQWIAFMQKRKVQELEKIIKDENLKPDETKHFVNNAFRDGEIPTIGTGIVKILPPVPRFSGNSEHAVKKQKVLGRLLKFFDRFFNLLSQ